MVCTANDLREWKDFPKGLRVLLLDRDSHSASDVRSKLEEMEYVVYSFCDEKEASSAILSTPGNFHIAILEVSAGAYDESFKLLKISKDLPVIMTSNVHCLSMMMKCIALGAVEFLLKPLSEDKLRNIWQHVIHKAFSNSPKTDKESIASILQLQSEDQDKNGISVDMKDFFWVLDDEHDQPAGSEKLPAPATPQLKQGVRWVDSWENQDQINPPMETDCKDKDGQSKFVETTSNCLFYEGPLLEGQPLSPGKTMIEEDKTIIPAAEHSIKGSDADHSAKSKSDRKRNKVDWTRELHRKFVQAVRLLGIDRAIPSKILELMKVEGLTRHNVASHLQKYRVQKKRLMHKVGYPCWPNPRGSVQTNHLKPITACLPYHSNCEISNSAVYPTWTRTIGYPANVQTWGSLGYHHWQPPGIHHWNSYRGVHADAGGCPVMLPYDAPCFSHQHVSATHNIHQPNNGYGMPHSSFDLQPDEEVIDMVVREAMSKPWSPLPLGLKLPPENILSELSTHSLFLLPSTVPDLAHPNSFQTQLN